MSTTLLLAMLCSAAWAEPAERVFVFVLDGLRADEGVEAEDTWLPYLWNTWRPQGTLIRQLTNRDSTITEPAHRMFLSGRRQPLSNFPWYEGRLLQRSLFPTVFEELSQQGDASSMVIGNTVFMESQGWSLYPGLGAELGAAEPTTEAISTVADDRIMALVAEDAESTERRLFVVNIHQPDKDGHAGRWDEYVEGMEAADGLIDEFVREHVGEEDAVVVFADHGRHTGDDWAGHGDACGGCRESFLLAWGAGVAEGVDLSGYELIDVAPTIGALLGIDMPLARGRVIEEVLAEPSEAVEDSQSLVDPWLAGASGRMHQVAQRAPGAGATGHLVYRRHDGTAWSDWSSFVDDSDVETPEAPRIWADGDTVVRAWRAYQPELLQWGLFAQRSVDGGGSWGEVVTLQSRAMYCAEPALLLLDGVWTGLWSGQSLGNTDRITTFTRVVWDEEVQSESLEAGELHMAVQPTAVATDDGAFVVLAAVDDPDYETANELRQLYGLRPSAGGELEVVTVALTEGVSLFPALVADGSTLHVAWSERAPGVAGTWSVQLATSVDAGATWSTPQEVALSAEAWRPAWVRHDAELGLAAVVIDEEGHHVEVRWLREGGWTPIERVASSTGVIEQLSGSEDGWLAWGDAASAAARTVHSTQITPPDPTDTAGTSSSDTDSGDDTGTDSPPCGCRAGPQSAAWWALLGVMLWRRRR